VVTLVEVVVVVTPVGAVVLVEVLMAEVALVVPDVVEEAMDVVKRKASPLIRSNYSVTLMSALFPSMFCSDGIVHECM